MSRATTLPVNEDIAWIAVGAKVRYLSHRGEPVGTKVMGEGHPDTAWICIGNVGKVIKLSTGYPRHRCPDHHKEPDCICGGSECSDEPGWVGAMAAWATVEYETDKPGRTIKRAIQRDEEGKNWERVS
jgi:hypothetical protein